jgi:hydroxylamine reductase
MLTQASGPVDLVLEKTRQGLIAQGKLVGIKSESATDPDLHSLHWLLTYGLKGVAAYTYHAYLLGKKDAKVFDFVSTAVSRQL